MTNAVTVKGLLPMLGVAVLALSLLLTGRASAAGIAVTSITPSKGPATSEMLVVIRGTGFPTGHGCEGALIDVKFDGLSAFPLELPTSTQVRVVAPVHAPGPVDVTVTNNCDGSSVTVVDGYTYLSAGIIGGAIPPRGFGLFVFGGGTNADLVKAAGCPGKTATFWATNPAGAFVTFIPAAEVEAANAPWNSLFSDGIPYNTALIGRCA